MGYQSDINEATPDADGNAYVAKGVKEIMQIMRQVRRNRTWRAHPEKTNKKTTTLLYILNVYI